MRGRCVNIEEIDKETGCLGEITEEPSETSKSVREKICKESKEKNERR
jgi:hypothetical protein